MVVLLGMTVGGGVSCLAPLGRLHGEPAWQQFFSSTLGSNGLFKDRRAGKIERVDADSFSKMVLRSDVPVLVDFYADWCGPCKALAPVLEELAEETADAKIVKVNVDHSPELADRYGIESIPSLVVFRGGRSVQRHRGMADKASLRRLLEENNDDN
jgi:thioredoxin 1